MEMSAFREDSFEEKQMDNIEKMKHTQNLRELQEFFDSASMQMGSANQKMPDVLLRGIRLVDMEVYKKDLPKFNEIYEKIQANSTIKALGILITSMNPNTPPLTDFSPFGVLKWASTNIDSKTNELLVSVIYLPNEETTKILKALKDYEYLTNWNNQNIDQTAQRFNALNLYMNAFEIYLKILKDMYSKLNDIEPEKVDNGKMYHYLEDNYPMLLDSTNNILRNDVAHLNYNEREKYTTKQLMEDSNTVIAKVFTSLDARNGLLIKLFEQNRDLFKPID